MTLAKKGLILFLFLGALTVLVIDSTIKPKSAQTESTLSKTILPDFTQYTDVNQKKTAFFEYMLPYIQKANAEILTERKAIKAMDINHLSTKQQTQLTVLLKKYRVKGDVVTAETKQTLLTKIDIIPPSLALAQAANESSWGTSRFAKHAFNFYGQWCFTKGCGLVPSQRTSGMNHEVRKFKTPYASVKGYMHNLNSHPAFKKLREQRMYARLQNQPPTGLALAKGLINYSERKEEYIEEIGAMIRHNKLDLLD